MDLLKTIVELLPYDHPFLFVDELTAINENGSEGHYTFREDEYFYRGHFKDRPVTPGVILTECMAQIGLVCLGIYLKQGSVTLSDPDERGIVSNGVNTKSVILSGSAKSRNVSKPVILSGSARSRSVSKDENLTFVFSESNMLFEKAVYPGEKVQVVSQKKYWRLGKLKCRVEMFNENSERVCSGELSGIILNEK